MMMIKCELPYVLHGRLSLTELRYVSYINFDVLLTVHLSIILAADQLNAQTLFHNKFIIFLYMFRALLCSSSGGQIVLYSIWYHHTETTHLFQCDDTRYSARNMYWNIINLL